MENNKEYQDDMDALDAMLDQQLASMPSTSTKEPALEKPDVSMVQEMVSDIVPEIDLSEYSDDVVQLSKEDKKELEESGEPIEQIVSKPPRKPNPKPAIKDDLEENDELLNDDGFEMDDDFDDDDPFGVSDDLQGIGTDDQPHFNTPREQVNRRIKIIAKVRVKAIDEIQGTVAKGLHKKIVGSRLKKLEDRKQYLVNLKNTKGLDASKEEELRTLEDHLRKGYATQDSYFDQVFMDEADRNDSIDSYVEELQISNYRPTSAQVMAHVLGGKPAINIVKLIGDAISVYLR